jgi:hypothetical protein
LEGFAMPVMPAEAPGMEWERAGPLDPAGRHGSMGPPGPSGQAWQHGAAWTHLWPG